MEDTETTTRPPHFLRKYKAYLIWFVLIIVYLYWVMLPEVLFVNGSGMTVDHVRIMIPGDNKVWRNIKHGKSKGFRYQPLTESGTYEVSIILSDGSRVRGKFGAITPWNLGHKAFFELSPDLQLRADFSYSILN